MTAHVDAVQLLGTLAEDAGYADVDTSKGKLKGCINGLYIPYVSRESHAKTY